MPLNKSYCRLILILASILYWGCVIFAVETYSSLYKQSILEESKEDSQRSMSLVRANFEAFVFQTVYTADSLATIITLNPNLALENWDAIAKAMVSKSKYIRSVGVAPDNVISHVYPLQGNEKALGFDMRRRPDQFASAMRAKELQEVYLDGPLELVQGGQALIVRFPIFLDAPDNKEYWGTVSVVLDYELILNDSGIHELDGLEMAIRRYYKHLTDPVVFFGSPSLFTEPDLVLPILLPNSKFEIAGNYKLESQLSLTWRINLIYLAGGAVSFGVFISALLLLRALGIARDAALQDELTKLPNRRFFMSYLKGRLSRSSKSSFAVLNIDLNDFKSVNDTFGHDVGDQFLQHVSSILQDSVRGSDIVARLGGDEFVVILDRVADHKQVQHVIDVIRENAETYPMTVCGQELSASFSIGISVCNDCENASLEAILVEADKNMYADKLAAKSKA